MKGLEPDVTLFSIESSEFSYYELLKYWQRSEEYNSARAQGDSTRVEARRWFDYYLNRSYLVEHAIHEGVADAYMFDVMFEYMCDRMLVRVPGGQYVKGLHKDYLSGRLPGRGSFFDGAINEWVFKEQKPLGAGLSIDSFSELREKRIEGACGLSFENELVDFVVDFLSGYDLVPGIEDLPKDDPRWHKVICRWDEVGIDQEFSVEDILSRYVVDPLVWQIRNGYILKKQIQAWVVERVNVRDAKYGEIDKDPVFQRNRIGFYHFDLYRFYQKGIFDKSDTQSEIVLKNLYDESLSEFGCSKSYGVEIFESQNVGEAIEAMNYFSHVGPVLEPVLIRRWEGIRAGVKSIELVNGYEDGEIDLGHELLLDQFNQGELIALVECNGGYLTARVLDRRGAYVLPFKKAKERLNLMHKTRKLEEVCALDLEFARMNYDLKMNFSREEIVELLVNPKNGE
ncbi:hypothetical protein MLD52_17850 [Puniceicoccaceae bacterium K14]|nr:hypothetical protein [Puniceicoccaceae bacterium K14]